MLDDTEFGFILGTAVGACVLTPISGSSLGKASSLTVAFSNDVTPTLAAFDDRDSMKDPLSNDCVMRVVLLFATLPADATASSHQPPHPMSTTISKSTSASFLAVEVMKILA